MSKVKYALGWFTVLYVFSYVSRVLPVFGLAGAIVAQIGLLARSAGTHLHALGLGGVAADLVIKTALRLRICGIILGDGDRTCTSGRSYAARRVWVRNAMPRRSSARQSHLGALAGHAVHSFHAERSAA
eukprot:scaffold113616_cov54-Phaeocystis_antarctica.AAC.1